MICNNIYNSPGGNTGGKLGNGLLDSFVFEEVGDDHGHMELHSFLGGETRTKTGDAAPASLLSIIVVLSSNAQSAELKLNVDVLALALKKAVTVKDHKSFMKIHPLTFRGPAALDWLTGHAARALFGAQGGQKRNQKLSRAVAMLLSQKLMLVGVFRQVTGSLSNPLDDNNALFRFHGDEREGPMLNCRSMWFKTARAPILVVTELLYALMNIVRTGQGQQLRESDAMAAFSAAAGELQMVSINHLNRVELLAFFINTFNLMALHGHIVRGSVEKSDFKPQKLAFIRDNHYMVAAYNYSISEIEERLLCRVVRSKYLPTNDRSRAPEPRVHFALSLCCASSPRIRIYQASDCSPGVVRHDS